MSIGVTTGMEWLSGPGGSSVEYTGGVGIDVDNTNHVISADLTEVQPKLTAGNNVSITNNVISSTNTTYSAGDGLALSGTQFRVTNPVPQAQSFQNGYVLSTDGQGGMAWSLRGNVLADNSTGNMNITLTQPDLDNGFVDYELERVTRTGFWVLFTSIVQVRPTYNGIEKIEFGFKNDSDSFYWLTRFDASQVRTAYENQEVKDWAIGHFDPWSHLVCRWTLSSSHAFNVGDTLSTHYNCICANAVTVL